MTLQWHTLELSLCRSIKQGWSDKVNGGESNRQLQRAVKTQSMWNKINHFQTSTPLDFLWTICTCRIMLYQTRQARPHLPKIQFRCRWPVSLGGWAPPGWGNRSATGVLHHQTKCRKKECMKHIEAHRQTGTSVWMPSWTLFGTKSKYWKKLHWTACIFKALLYTYPRNTNQATFWSTRGLAFWRTIVNNLL